ncbi:nuclear transport factor 2 family protein [Rhodococcus sp. 14C212]|uniref:nuclear transport factor 2 family protein n=1 Tax=Rhodococcus sp. 14C212 TaxID=2711209 RepID=UPI0013EB3CBD|nr:nuclear transport factor 2 family protein [Rhodococcus sp. 14C212]NGP06758.1 nuclear transport factor 2 family protein [Rhodococcus sp. 14C212]
MEQNRSLEERLRAVEARLAIGELLNRYAQALDYGDEDTFVDCFTETARYDMYLPPDSEDPPFPARGGELVDGCLRYTGHTAMRAFIEGHTRAPFVIHKHYAVNPIITVDGSTASSVSYMLRLDVSPEHTVYVRAFGRYVDDLIECADGRWRIAHRRAYAENLDMRQFQRLEQVGPGD